MSFRSFFSTSSFGVILAFFSLCTVVFIHNWQLRTRAKGERETEQQPEKDRNKVTERTTTTTANAWDINWRGFCHVSDKSYRKDKSSERENAWKSWRCSAAMFMCAVLYFIVVVVIVVVVVIFFLVMPAHASRHERTNVRQRAREGEHKESESITKRTSYAATAERRGVKVLQMKIYSSKVINEYKFLVWFSGFIPQCMCAFITYYFFPSRLFFSFNSFY